MKANSFAVLAAMAVSALANASCKPYVTSEKLQQLINLEDLLAGSRKLQDFADANNNTRSFGSRGHNATVDWLYDTLVATNYFHVEKQPLVQTFYNATGSVIIDGTPLNMVPMRYSPSLSFSGPLTRVAHLGCDEGDYPKDVKGKVALIARGNCTLPQKAILANKTGAVGIIVYETDPSQTGPLRGRLEPAWLDYTAAVGISLQDGEVLIAALEAGEVTVDFELKAIIEDRVNFNVFAETLSGDHNSVLVVGGHSDSVQAGPGINDNGSGIVGILAVALALTQFRVKNAVRFAFFTSEEFGLAGSYYYLKSLNGTLGGDVGEVDKVRAYLNFDMIASPNYVLGIYDGDGSAFNLTGAPGSDVLERDFELFFQERGLDHVPSAIDGGSDYAAFVQNGIPIGGLFTGAGQIKTEREAALFGGKSGVAYDINYHQKGDTFNNLNHDAFIVNSLAIANSVAKYAIDFSSLPVGNKEKRQLNKQRMEQYMDKFELGGLAPVHAGGDSGTCGSGYIL